MDNCRRGRRVSDKWCKKNVKRGDVLNIKVGDKHAIKANTQLTFVEVQLGKELTEDDIVRIKMEF